MHTEQFHELIKTLCHKFRNLFELLVLKIFDNGNVRKNLNVEKIEVA